MSEKPLDPGGYADERLWADDLAAVIDQTGLERPVLVAWSYGGFVVTDYVRAHGEAGIAGIDLVGGAVLLTPPTFDHIGPGLLENAQATCAPGSPHEHRRHPALPARLHRAGRSTTELWSTALCWNMVVPPEVRGALIAREIDADDVLARLSVPVLVTHGRDDAIVLPSMAEHVAGALRRRRGPSWYEGVGHMPFVEDAERFDLSAELVRQDA